ncbi:hypothetical protein LFM09_33675 [Lentzea alba]|uniref:hypothetical protein n=1 Tax=Lentzea alba TaxID=2714351 RepID=UPI0039BF1601
MRPDEITAEQEEHLVREMLRHQVGIDPDQAGAVLDMAAVGLVNGAWRNSPVEDWHAGDGPLSDGDMLRINSHTTRRVRDMLRRWRTDCSIDAHSPTADLNTVDVDTVEWLLRKLYRWLTDPKRKLPIGLTLADIAGDGLDEFTDHAADTLGAVAVLAEERSTRFAFERAAAHGGLACRHWWGTPTWPQLVDRFTTAVDDASDPHWGGGRTMVRPPSRAAGTDHGQQQPATAATATSLEAGRAFGELHRDCGHRLHARLCTTADAHTRQPLTSSQHLHSAIARTAH